MNMQHQSEQKKFATHVPSLPHYNALQRKYDSNETTYINDSRRLRHISQVGRHSSANYHAAPLPVFPSKHDILSTSGQPLDSDIRTYMETRFRHDFSKVRVHTDEKAAASAQAFNALAYTMGTDLVFGAGQYTPATTQGKKLLAHELTHVVQQNRKTATEQGHPGSASTSDPVSSNELIADKIADHVSRGDGVRHGQNQESVVDLTTSTSFLPSQISTVQRKAKTVTMPPEVVSSNPSTAKRVFSQNREIVRLYCNDILNYVSIQFLDAVRLFDSWYQQQPQADASFFNNVINSIMNTAWAWGSPTVGAIVAPIGSAIMFIAQEVANDIKTKNDEFTTSLVNAAVNLQHKLNKEMGDVPGLLEKNAPGLWQEIERLAYIGEDWHPLIHREAGLPRRDVDYQVILLAQLIFEYRKWQLSQRSRDYQAIYSLNDPHLTHMRGRSMAEAHALSSEPIPKVLGKYSHQGEKVEK